MPIPNNIDKCMSDPKMIEEYPDEKQRYAVCKSAAEDKSLLEEVDEAIAKTYKYRDPKTGQIFEYDRPGIYENDGRKLVPVR